MTKKFDSAGERLFRLWQKLASKPAGKWLFNRIIAWKIPYSGSIKAQVLELSAGKSKVRLPFRKANTNHLNSVHALALSNLGELSSGLAMLCGLPGNIRGIPTRIDTEYLKKARGHLTAIAEVALPEVSEDKTEHWVQANIYDQQEDLVTTVKVRWVLSPIE